MPITNSSIRFVERDMFSKIVNKFWRKLAFRLTLWYAIIFTASLFGALCVFYIMITSTLQRNIDTGLLEELAEVSETMEFLGTDSAYKALKIESESEGIDKMYLRLLDPTGNVIAESDMTYWKTAGINKDALHRISAGESPVFDMETIPGRHHKIRVVYGKIAAGKILQIGIFLEEKDHFLNTIKIVIIPIMIIFVLFSAIIGWFMANRALSDVEEITKTAQNISQGAYNQRVQIKSKSDEIKLLAETFNRMLDHINGLMKGLREITDNIAHDLKTPITRMRIASETELGGAKCSEDTKMLAAGTIEECDNLLQMIDTMLMISKEESGILEMVKKPVDLSQIIKDAFELFSPITKEKGIQCLNQVPDNVVIEGDFHGLQRMVINLLENAVKYTPAGGIVTVSSRIEDDMIRIVFHDTGIGISGEDIPHIFKRLYRCDKSRSQQGFGLGLSLALAIANAHLGNITVTSRLGEGSTFTVILPR
jgi:signal transduction histidine kinase